MGENKKINFCRYFADIEADPTAITPRLTMRQFMEAKEHLYGCDACFNRSERVLARMPEQKYPKRGTN